MLTRIERMRAARIAPAGDSAQSRAITPAIGDGADLWCGPAAVSILTGCTVELASLLVCRWRAGCDSSRRLNPTGIVETVGGTYAEELLWALQCLGFETTLEPGATWLPGGRESVTTVSGMFRGPELRQFTARAGRIGSDAWLVGTAGHWCVVQGETFADSRQGFVPLCDARGQRARVRLAGIVRRLWIVDYAEVRDAAIS